MKKNVMSWLVASAVVSAMLLAAPVKAADGKKAFVDNKCNKCHSMKSQGIEKIKAEANAEASEEEKPSCEAPDLSKLGSEATKGGAAFVKDFLKKKEGVKVTCAEGPKKGSQLPHKKEFKGADADLDALVQLLVK